jgi:microtubule-associated protein-like 6
MHPSRQIAATGQMASSGKAKCIDIYVWDIETKEILARFNDFHRRAVYLLQFSTSGQYLASIGQDDDNSIAVYDWKTKRLISTSTVDKAKVNSLAWQSDESLVTCGCKHVKFWDIKGRNIS